METLTKIQDKTDSSFVDLFNDWKELNTNDNRTTFKLDLKVIRLSLVFNSFQSLNKSTNDEPVLSCIFVSVSIL